MLRRLLVLLVALSMLAALPARADDIASAVNSVRSSALTVNGTVDAFAQAAAQRIAASQSLVHSNLGPLLGECSAAGEVIGFGPDVRTVINAFVASPGHMSTMNQSKWNAMGTGLAVDGSGVLWIAVVFCALASAPPPPPPAPPPPAPPPPAAPAPAPAPTPAPAPAPASAPAPAPPSIETPPPPPPEDDPPILRILGPFMTSDGTVSMVMGASPFLPEEEWRVVRFPSIN